MTPNQTPKRTPITIEQLDKLDAEMERDAGHIAAVEADLQQQRSRLTRNRSILREARENIDILDRDQLDHLLASESPAS